MLWAAGLFNAIIVADLIYIHAFALAVIASLPAVGLVLALTALDRLERDERELREKDHRK